MTPAIRLAAQARRRRSILRSAVPVGVLVLALLAVPGCDTGEPPDPPEPGPLTTDVITIASGATWSAAQFAPDGQTILYLVTDATGEGSSVLRTSDRSGTTLGEVALTGGALPAGRVSAFAVSSDGQRIAYSIASVGQEGVPAWSVVLARRDGTEAEVVLRAGEGPVAALTQLDPVAFAPDGSAVALAGFDKKQSSGFETWIFRPGDRTVTRIAENGAAKPIGFAPSGDLLISRAMQNGALALIGLDGGNERVVASGGTIVPPGDAANAFANDGRLLFGRLAFDGTETGSGVLYTVTTGGEEATLTDDDGFKQPLGLSPDGGRALYTLEISVAGGIAVTPYIVETAAGAEPRRLVDGFAEARALAFSPDASRVLFSSQQGGTPTLHLATL